MPGRCRVASCGPTRTSIRPRPGNSPRKRGCARAPGTWSSSAATGRRTGIRACGWSPSPTGRSVPTCRHTRGGGDALAAALTPVREIERGDVRLAFDHERIVRDAVERTRSKLEYTALAAKFCPPEFTIRQLRRAYEAVWNTRLDPGNFQRNVQESGVFVKRIEAAAEPPSGRGRPASLWSVGAGSLDDAQPPTPLARPPARRRRAAGRQAQVPAAAAPSRNRVAAPTAEDEKSGEDKDQD